MTATFAEVVDGQVYVYVRGRLIWKRWQRIAGGFLFQVAPAAAYWTKETLAPGVAEGPK